MWFLPWKENGESVKGLNGHGRVIFVSYKDHAGYRWRLLDWRALSGGLEAFEESLGDFFFEC